MNSVIFLIQLWAHQGTENRLRLFFAIPHRALSKYPDPTNQYHVVEG